MKIHWKRIGTSLLTGLNFAGAFDPRLATLATLIESVEGTLTSGASKKAKVEALSNAILESEFLTLTPAQRTALMTARSAYIDAYVAMRNAEAATEAAAAAFTKALPTATA